VNLLREHITRKDIFISTIAVIAVLSIVCIGGYNISLILGILLFLLFFVSLTLIDHLFLGCKIAYMWYKKFVAKKVHKKHLRQAVERAFVGMKTEYKMEAVRIIKEAIKDKHEPFTYIIHSDMYELLGHCSDHYKNPFQIYLGMSYVSLITLIKQYDYDIVVFNKHFHKLIQSHSNEIEKTFQEECPYEYKLWKNRKINNSIPHSFEKKKI